MEILEGKTIVIRPDGVVFDAIQSDRIGNRVELPLDQIVHNYRHNTKNFLHDLEEQLLHSRRNLVKESFEVAKSYCNETDQFGAFMSTPWYKFAKIIRDCVSHSFHFDFKKKDLPMLPVEYQGITIHADLQNTAILQSHLPVFVAFELHREIVEFVQSH